MKCPNVDKTLTKPTSEELKYMLMQLQFSLWEMATSVIDPQVSNDFAVHRVLRLVVCITEPDCLARYGKRYFYIQPNVSALEALLEEASDTLEHPDWDYHLMSPSDIPTGVTPCWWNTKTETWRD